ncbi:Os10g0428500, partial [Oryza sativa Japonica Group]
EVRPSQGRLFHHPVRHSRRPQDPHQGDGGDLTCRNICICAAIRHEPAVRRPAGDREGRGCGVRGRRPDVRRAPVRARGAVAGLQSGALRLDEGRRHCWSRVH